MKERKKQTDKDKVLKGQLNEKETSEERQRHFRQFYKVMQGNHPLNMSKMAEGEGQLFLKDSCSAAVNTQRFLNDEEKHYPGHTKRPPWEKQLRVTQ